MNTESTLTDSAGTIYYLVEYPSGMALRVTGRFRLAALDRWLIPVIEQPDGSVIVLDQRGVVTHDEVIVYSPRRNLDGLQLEMTQWLNEHPGWAKRL